MPRHGIDYLKVLAVIPVKEAKVILEYLSFNLM